LTFSNSAGSYTLSGTAFTNGASGIVNNSSNAQTISNGITLGAAQSFDAAAGNLTFAGATANNGNLLTIAGNSNTVVSGVISGSGGLTKDGTGSLTLDGNNTFTGTLAANAGTTLLNGTQDTTTVNVAGGTLQLGAADRLADSSTLTLSSGTLNFGTFTDTVTTFNQSGGVFTNGTVNATTYGLSGGTVAGTLGAGTANVTGGVALSGTANSTLNINTGGTLTLAANDRIGNSSAVTVNAGTLATATFTDTVDLSPCAAAACGLRDFVQR
jgi:autotransporter-associated beta strand protein